ncbi:MAG: type II toxin-antitoxin system Phd/YefM family antitoxin [Chloroflexi bacterium]|nr:type II toxin-antitoxin system Phd/YefM family antitoxin [Chloroflexota bacterium]
MREVGVRELRQKASQLLRELQQDREPIVITSRGKAVARLVPLETEESREARFQATWARMDELADEIAASWPAGVSAVEAVREQRRER